VCASCVEPKALSELAQCFYCEAWFCEACLRPSRHRCQTYRELGLGTAAPVPQAPPPGLVLPGPLPGRPWSLLLTVEERRASYFLERRADQQSSTPGDFLRRWRLAGEADSPISARTSSSSSGEEQEEEEQDSTRTPSTSSGGEQDSSSGEEEQDSQGGASPMRAGLTESPKKMRAGLTESPPGDCSPED